MTEILRVATHIEPTILIMSKEAVHVHILGNSSLLNPLVIHIYKNVLHWKFLLIKKGLRCLTVPIP